MNEAQVDLETGVARRQETILAYNCGCPLNSLNVRTQTEGGAVNEVGQALHKKLTLDQAISGNSNLDWAGHSQIYELMYSI